MRCSASSATTLTQNACPLTGRPYSPPALPVSIGHVTMTTRNWCETCAVCVGRTAISWPARIGGWVERWWLSWSAGCWIWLAARWCTRGMTWEICSGRAGCVTAGVTAWPCVRGRRACTAPRYPAWRWGCCIGSVDDIDRRLPAVCTTELFATSPHLQAPYFHHDPEHTDIITGTLSAMAAARRRSAAGREFRTRSRLSASVPAEYMLILWPTFVAYLSLQILHILNLTPLVWRLKHGSGLCRPIPEALQLILPSRSQSSDI